MAKIVIDAEDLSLALEGWGGLGSLPVYFLDRETGEIFFCSPDYESDDEDDPCKHLDDYPERYVGITPLPSHESYKIMEAFVEQLPNERVASRLARAIGGRSPFRRFKDALLDYPDVREAWFQFRDDAMFEVGRQWLENEGIEADMKWPRREQKTSD